MTFPDYSQLGTQHAQPGFTFRLGADALLAGRSIPAFAIFSSAAQARLSQEAVEVLASGTPAARTTQFGIEVVAKGNANARITQAGLEIVTKGIPHARITQFGIEVVTKGISHARITQFGIEVVVAVTRRTIIISAIFSKATVTTHTRTVPTQVWFKGRIIPTLAAWKATRSRPIFVSAEIGLHRRIFTSAAFQGKSARTIRTFAQFHFPGLIPTTASFWEPIASWHVISDTLTKVMSLSSHLVGGTVGTYLGVYAQAINAPYPANWNIPSYNDSFWPYAFNTGFGFPIPFPTSIAGLIYADFYWGWPNTTNDFSINGDPFNDIVLLRRVFGLPNDQNVVNATSGSLTVAASGIFDVSTPIVTINGNTLPFVGFVPHPGGDVSSIWTVPSNVLLPGTNVIAMSFTSYISVGIGARSGDFVLTLNYRPPLTGLPQVIG